MTSPVSRDRLDAIRARHAHDVDLGRWGEDEADLLAAAAYALDADDRLAASEAEVERLATEGPTFASFTSSWSARLGAAHRERDALAATIAKVRALCDGAGWDFVDPEDILAILDGEAQ